MRRPSQTARADGPNHAHHRMRQANHVHRECKLRGLTDGRRHYAKRRCLAAGDVDPAGL
jgi:hypothetical protein